MNEATAILQVLWTSLAGAASLVLFGAAFSLVLHVVKAWNFAHAAFMGLALCALYAAHRLLHWPLAALVAVAFALACAATCAAQPRARSSPQLALLVFVLTVPQLLAYGFTLAAGTAAVPAVPHLMSHTRFVAGVAVSNWDLGALLVAAGMLGLLHAFVTRTHAGRAVLAATDDAEPAGARRARVAALCVAAVLVAAGMVVDGTHVALGTASSPLPLVLFATIATLLAGAGKVFRAAGAALVLALAQGVGIFALALAAHA